MANSPTTAVATFLLKLLLAPAFVVGVSLAVRRWGPRVGGILGGLPVIAGPILLVLAVSRGARFTAPAADGILLGLLSLSAFMAVYALSSAVLAWWQSLALALATFVAMTAVLDPVSVAAPVGFGLACLAFVLVIAVVDSGAPAPAPAVPPGWDLPLRAGAAAAMVVAVTGVASSLGAHLAGLVSAFPIITSILAAFTHAQTGSGATRRLLRGMARGLFAYAAFCAIVGTTVRPLGTAPAFLIATAVALSIGAAVLWLTRESDDPGGDVQRRVARG